MELLKGDEEDNMSSTKREIGVFTDEELAAIIAALENDQERALVDLMMECGPTPRQLDDLRAVDVGHDCIYLHTTYLLGRRVPVSTELCDRLRSLAQDGAIWTDGRGRHLTSAALRGRIRNMVLRAVIDMPFAGAMVFRTTMMVNFVRMGGSVEELMPIVGHMAPSQTRLVSSMARR